MVINPKNLNALNTKLMNEKDKVKLNVIFVATAAIFGLQIVTLIFLINLYII